jgi:hypothetical protein
MAKKQSTSSTSTLASQVLAGKKPTPAQAKTLAASVLGQDERKGQGKAAPASKPAPKKP